MAVEMSTTEGSHLNWGQEYSLRGQGGIGSVRTSGVWAVLDEGQLIAMAAATGQGSLQLALQNAQLGLRGLAQRCHRDEETEAAEKPSNVTKVTSLVGGGQQEAPSRMALPPLRVLGSSRSLQRVCREQSWGCRSPGHPGHPGHPGQLAPRALLSLYRTWGKWGRVWAPEPGAPGCDFLILSLVGV